MADFVAVLRKTLDGLGDTAPATRERVYAKARATIAAKLEAINPPPPKAVSDRQKAALEEAIATLEKEFTAAELPKNDPLAELESVFASLKNPQPRVLMPPTAKIEPRPTVIDPLAHDPAGWVADPADLAGYEPGPNAPQAPQQILVPPQVPIDVVSQEARREGLDHSTEPPRRNYAGLVVAGLVLAVVAGGGYGIWLNKDAFGKLFGMQGPPIAADQPPATQPAEPEPEVAEQEPAEAETPPAPAVAPSTAPEAPEEPKLTQRLTPEGTEVDPGPAGGETGIGEGTSVAELTQPPPDAAPSPAPAAPVVAAPATPDPAVPTPPAGAEPAVPPVAVPAAPVEPPAQAGESVAVGQKAIFYEERTGSSEGSAEPGSIVWSVVQESPGANLPPEPAIRAEATIPGKDLQLRMTIRRNADQTLPASHIIEMIFLTPPGFEGGGIENILRVAMKGSEQEAGNPLIGIPAKIADGFFLVALNDTKAEIDANLTLLQRQSWIDVPIVYKTGRRALFTMEKGIPGEKVFNDAMAAWQAASAATPAAPG